MGKTKPSPTTIRPKPYYTTYPNSAWYWFDVKVYGEHLPKTGNLPSDVFARLKGGRDGGASRLYTSEAEAIADLDQALTPGVK